jgi:hypothetical protein
MFISRSLRTKGDGQSPTQGRNAIRLKTGREGRNEGRKLRKKDEKKKDEER